MADIQQWRRKIHSGIQPARSRTPAQITPLPDTEESDDYFSASTPRRRLKPKLSSYFTHNSKSSHQDEAAVVYRVPSWPPDQLYPDPKPEIVMDALMCRLIANPLEQLDASHNSSLMLIFEAYLKLRDEKKLLQLQLETEKRSTEAVIAKLNMSEKDWLDEKQDYKDEVKRLEVLLAKLSRRGVAEVTLARQDSKLYARKDVDRKETVFEFLEKTTKRYGNEKTWSSQRAYMKPILQSPSDQDKRLSRTLAQKKSMTNIHAELPFGTPPQDNRFSLNNAPILDLSQDKAGRRRSNTASTFQSISTDTFSTFSCEEILPISDNNGSDTHDGEFANDDFAAVHKLALALAHRRNMDANRVMPQVLDLFGIHVGKANRSASMPVNAVVETAWPQRISSVRANLETIAPKHRTVMSKASGFFQKLKPQQLTADATASQSPKPLRRFSFEPGDDFTTHPTGSAPSVGLTSTMKDRVLRKSVSLHALVDTPPDPLERSLSPIAHSPTPSSLTTEGRPASRIPTPIRVGSLAKPRSVREDSAASLLAVIHHLEERPTRSNSLTNSDYSSASTSRVDLWKASAQPQQCDPSAVRVKSSSSSNRLLDHTNALRGTSLAQSAARTVLVDVDSKEQRAHWKHSGARSTHSVYSSFSDPDDARCENTAPVG